MREDTNRSDGPERGRRVIALVPVRAAFGELGRRPVVETPVTDAPTDGPRAPRLS